MPNSTKHFIIGGIATFLVDCIVQKRNSGQINFRRALGRGLLGGGIALLPDILEPAVNPDHRGFFHSFAVGACLLAVNKKIKENPGIPDKTKNLLFALSSAYGSHLALDATTSKSLPLLS